MSVATIHDIHPDVPLPGAAEPEAPAGPPVLRAHNLAARYAGQAEAALDGVDFEVRRGERVALLGPSGCGKTTLLRVLEGSLPLGAGSIRAEGKAALVYQDFRLVPELSVLRNVCSGALEETRGTLRGGRFPKEIRERAMGLLEELGLSAYAHERASSLSGGQRQRVAIARALCARPAVLLADEPLCSLDPENSERILRLLARLQKRHGFALVVSMHDEGPDPDFFNRFLVLDKGRVNRQTADATSAWEFFEERRRLLREEEDTAGQPKQDRFAGAPSGAAAAFRWGLGLGVLALALGWAIRGLGLEGSSFGGALAGLTGFLTAMVPGSLEEVRALPWATLGAGLLETIQMAIIGTFAGLVLSLPLAVLASEQTAPRWLRHPVRLMLNAIRTIPSILWALIFVAVVGLGPIAGVFALAAFSMGYLTKFFYEGLEGVDTRPAGALRALGASPFQVFFQAVLPAARPTLLASCLFVFEYNIRSASILGVVGAGGIGQHLMYYIDWREFPAAFAGLLMLLVVVVALDTLSQWWRRRLVAQRGI